MKYVFASLEDNKNPKIQKRAVACLVDFIRCNNPLIFLFKFNILKSFWKMKKNTKLLFSTQILFLKIRLEFSLAQLKRWTLEQLLNVLPVSV